MVCVIFLFHRKVFSLMFVNLEISSSLSREVSGYLAISLVLPTDSPWDTVWAGFVVGEVPGG